jgi:hypothetical protein
MNPETFERALDSWDPWLKSITDGRKVLQSSSRHPSLEEMRLLARTTLTELGFSPCNMFELYWLCCIYSDYDTEYVAKRHKDFRFERLVLPEWFPLPFGFHHEALHLVDFKGKRILPCEVWTEDDLKWQIRQRMQVYPPHFVGREGTVPVDRRGLAEKGVAEYLADWAIVIAADHLIHKFVKRGRPTKPIADGWILAEQRADGLPSVAMTSRECPKCRGLVWEDHCMICGWSEGLQLP